MAEIPWCKYFLHTYCRYNIHGYIHGIHGFHEYEYEYRIFFMDNIRGYIHPLENLRYEYEYAKFSWWGALSI